MYLINADGTGKVQLTHFNEPGYPEYDPLSKQTTESTWSNDGSYIIFGHVSSEISGGPYLPSSLYKITFKGSCGNSSD